MLLLFTTAIPKLLKNACERSGFFFSSRRRHTRLQGDWSSDVCSSDLYIEWNLGYCYDLGVGVKANRAKALYWYRRACRHGESGAAHNIGTVWRDAHNVRREIGRASCRERRSTWVVAVSAA